MNVAKPKIKPTLNSLMGWKEKSERERCMCVCDCGQADGCVRGAALGASTVTAVRAVLKQ